MMPLLPPMVKQINDVKVWLFVGEFCLSFWAVRSSRTDTMLELTAEWGTGMAIRTPLLTVLSKGPPIILRGSFLLFLNQYRNWQILSMGRDELLLLELSQQVIPFAMSNPTFVVLMGAFLATCSLERPTFNEPSSWLAARLPGKCTPQPYSKFAKTGMTDIDPAVRRWQNRLAGGWWCFDILENMQAHYHKILMCFKKGLYLLTLSFGHVCIFAICSFQVVVKDH